MSGPGAALAWCPFPDQTSAHAAAARLLDEHLIACANVLPGITSIYRYEGNIKSGAEVGVLFKTTDAAIDALVARIAELHPYEAPAILAWRCDNAHPATLGWLLEAVPADR